MGKIKKNAATLATKKTASEKVAANAGVTNPVEKFNLNKEQMEELNSALLRINRCIFKNENMCAFYTLMMHCNEDYEREYYILDGKETPLDNGYSILRLADPREVSDLKKALNLDRVNQYYLFND